MPSHPESILRVGDHVSVAASRFDGESSADEHDESRWSYQFYGREKWQSARCYGRLVGDEGKGFWSVQWSEPPWEGKQDVLRYDMLRRESDGEATNKKCQSKRPRSAAERPDADQEDEQQHASQRFRFDADPASDAQDVGDTSVVLGGRAVGRSSQDFECDGADVARAEEHVERAAFLLQNASSQHIVLGRTSPVADERGTTEQGGAECSEVDGSQQQMQRGDELIYERTHQRGDAWIHACRRGCGRTFMHPPGVQPPTVHRFFADCDVFADCDEILWQRESSMRSRAAVVAS